MSGSTGRLVLVVGATGRQGGSVLRHLLERQIPVRALIRSAEGPRAKARADQGVEIAVGDMDDPLSLKQAMTGVRGVYSMQDYWSVGARREVQQGKNMADAAAEAGVAHFVYSSVVGAERDSGIDHWETKWAIEQVRWFNAGDYQADIAGLRRGYPQIRPTSLEDWLRREGWENRRTITVRRDKIGRLLPAR